MRFLKPGKGLIGVDITSATVKLLELKQCHDNYQVESYAVRPLREGAVVERRIRDIDGVATIHDNPAGCFAYLHDLIDADSALAAVVAF